jgi:hypothetical protein
MRGATTQTSPTAHPKELTATAVPSAQLFNVERYASAGQLSTTKH